MTCRDTTYPVGTSETVQVSRFVDQYITLMFDGSLNDGVLFFKIVSLDVAVELS